MPKRRKYGQAVGVNGPVAFLVLFKKKTFFFLFYLLQIILVKASYRALLKLQSCLNVTVDKFHLFCAQKCFWYEFFVNVDDVV